MLLLSLLKLHFIVLGLSLQLLLEAGDLLCRLVKLAATLDKLLLDLLLRQFVELIVGLPSLPASVNLVLLDLMLKVVVDQLELSLQHRYLVVEV